MCAVVRSCCRALMSSSFFFFNATPPTDIYTLSLHDALPIYCQDGGQHGGIEPGTVRHGGRNERHARRGGRGHRSVDRKSTRLNSSHQIISYAVFCLKKKKKNAQQSYLGRSMVRPNGFSSSRS